MSPVLRTKTLLHVFLLSLLVATATMLQATAQTLSPGSTWVKQSPATVPPARQGQAMAYDATHKQVVLFGGYQFSSGSALGDTWTYDGTTWTQHTVTGPAGRYGAAMTFDPSSGQVLLFGGNQLGNYLADTWLWNGTAWTQQQPANHPSARYQFGLTSDLTNNNVVLFGGEDGNGQQGDTWLWANGQWTVQSGNTHPSAREGAQMTYNNAAGNVVLFGGGSSFGSDTWIWNGSAWTQQTTTVAPPGRYNGQMVFDADLNGVVLFGGGNFTTLMSDTWLWNGTAWSQLRPVQSPSGREQLAMVYDVALGEPLLFGGNTGSGGYFQNNETWLFQAGQFAAQATLVGSSSATVAVPFQITGAGALPALSNSNVLTQGAPGLDFTLATGSTCTGQVTANSSCVVNVVFTPKAAGQRLGAVTLLDSSGNTLATALVSGTGTGPQVAFPSSSSPTASFGSGLSGPSGIATDSVGNVYVADSNNNAVKKFAFSGGAYQAPVAIGSGFSHPLGVAVDGNGNVYVADEGNDTVKQIPFSAGAYLPPVALPGNFLTPYALAVDAAGNVYVADSGHSAIKKIPYAGGSYQPPVTLVSGYQYPYGVAVDSAGNVYAANDTPSILKIPYAAGSYGSPTQISLGSALLVGVAADAAGNVYATDILNSSILELPYNGSSYGSPVPVGNPVGLPYGVAVDGQGNVYASDNQNNILYDIALTTPPSLTFAGTAPGGTSSDSPKTVSLQNIGNADLSFPVPGLGSNPSISPNFSLNASGSTACPQVTSTSPSPTTLAAGAVCNLVISFTPSSSISSSATASGAVALRDNNLNVNGAGQNVNLSGQVVVVTLSPAAGALPAATLGQTYSQTITASGGTANYTFSATGLPAGLSLNSSSGVLSGTPTQAGSYSFSITATDANNVTGTQNYTLAVNAIATTTTVTGRIANPTYSTTANEQIVDVTVTSTSGTPTGRVGVSLDGGSVANYNLTNGGAGLGYSGLAPGNHTVVATYAAQGQYAASTSSTYTFTISKATATVTLGSLNQTYTGQPLSATATTSPNGLNVTITYNGSTTAPTAAGNYAVVATVNDTNYQGSANGTLVIGQAGTTISTPPTASNITYGQTLASSTLSGGTGTANGNPIAGTFAFAYPNTRPSMAATGGYPVTFTPADSTNYASSTTTIPVTTNKATPTVSVNPTASAITYGQTLASSTLTGGTATANGSTVPGTFTFNTPSTAPAAGTANQAITFTPSDTTNYNTVALTVPVTVNQATPTVSTLPTAAAITYGQSLASSTLTGGVATYNSSNVAGSFSLASPATVPNAGTANQPVTFTPTDTTDYTTVTLTVPVTVNKATATVTVGSLSATYDGNPHAATASTTPAGLTVTLTYNGAATAPTAAGSYTVGATVNDSNYNGTATGTLVIAQASAPITFAVPNHTYGDAPFAVTASSSSTGAFTYAVVSGPATVSGSTVTLTGAGTVTLQASQAATANYSANTQTTSFTVSQNTATVTFTVPNHTYGDASFAVSASSPSTGAYTYSVVSGPATVNGNTVTLTGAGAVTLRASQAADANYTAFTQTATFTVSSAGTVLLFPQPASLVYGTPLGAAQLNATATASGIGAVPGTFSYTPGPGTILGAGSTTLTVQFTPSNSANFTTPATATTMLTVTQAATTTQVTTSASPVLERVPVTFTANVKTVAGGTTPTGNVTFFDGQTTLGTATLNASGFATYTATSGFAGAGNHTITAAFVGNVNQAASSGTVVQAIGTASTLVLTDAGQPSYSATVQRGFASQTTVTVTPGATFAGTISFSCSGLPANVSCEFTPSSITLAQGSSSQSVGLLIRSASLQTASLEGPHAAETTGSRITLALALPGIVLAGLASRSRRLRGSQRLVLAFFCLASLATMAGLTGCGSGASPLYSTTNAAPGTYTFNVVASSGGTTATLPVTLTIQ